MHNGIGRPKINNVVDSNLVLVGEPNITSHLAMPRKFWIQLHRIAMKLGCLHGVRPSISRMLREIAKGELTVVRTENLITEDELHIVTTQILPPEISEEPEQTVRPTPQYLTEPEPAPPVPDPGCPEQEPYDPLQAELDEIPEYLP